MTWVEWVAGVYGAGLGALMVAGLSEKQGVRRVVMPVWQWVYAGVSAVGRRIVRKRVV